MCKRYLSLLSAALVLSLAESAPPPSVTKCKVDDTKCLQESTRSLIPIFGDGIPEYKVEVLDPVTIKSINASQTNLLFTLTDVTVSGLKTCQPTEVKRDVENSKIVVTLSCVAVILEGDYILQGAVLVVPVNGNGKLYVKLNAPVLHMEMDVSEKIGSDGKRHWSIKSFTHSYDLKEKAEISFEHLNEDNELLSQASRELLRNNGNEVVKEIGKPVIQAGLTRVVKNVNHFFKANTVEDLSL